MGSVPHVVCYVLPDKAFGDKLRILFLVSRGDATFVRQRETMLGLQLN